MRQPTMTSHAQSISIPRGWIVLGAALLSWALVAATWSMTTQLFAYVSAAI